MLLSTPSTFAHLNAAARAANLLCVEVTLQSAIAEERAEKVRERVWVAAV